ncbi:hypothetical protein INS49_015062 [Diaporthe citri]|uniref:uncharacterized protein n=1 Tax=Diaporthe citri TaxID=83186 RepID=UPI001C80E2D8|nr:uncharacterized protein INS49_015062 [Diaporthe citri]KAG6357184.1 hypothetical protein INS49_015062 [Diaporthe citri]
MHVRNYKGRNGPTDRPATNSPAQACAQNLSQQTTPPEESNMYPGLKAADARYFKTSVPEACPKAARQARNPTFFTELQSRPGQKRHLNDHDEEADAEEPLHKRPRAKAVRQADKDTRAHERTCGMAGREDDADKHAEFEQSSGTGSRVCQHSTSKDPSRYQERGNLNMDAVKSSQDGTAEAKQRRKSADVERSSIAPLKITTRSSGILQNSKSSRPILGSLKKKVRFEDEVPGKVLEKPACLGNRFNETPKEQMAGSESQIPNAAQRKVLSQPADADVIMLDVETALSALSVLQSHQ